MNKSTENLFKFENIILILTLFLIFEAIYKIVQYKMQSNNSKEDKENLKKNNWFNLWRNLILWLVLLYADIDLFFCSTQSRPCLVSKSVLILIIAPLIWFGERLL